MKVSKPLWVNHDDKPIFSVDVHQECQVFATGGQGMDSGRVVIWNLLPVVSEKAEQDESVPKMLCQMDSHLACVNCVRWSQKGHMLASGSDDKLVMIWRKTKGPSGMFGSGGVHKNHESWKCCATLRGHSGDVLDLAWSPHDRWLASCSIDNTIIVWDVHAFPTVIASLRGHTGLVKGVAWDPIGKFLSSQSDDRSVKIWKTTDWTCNNTITEPFEECGGTTHILRLSWSPDGQYLVSAHAMNGGGPTAQVIEREGWKCDKDFVGHRKAVTCVRFNNSILKRQSPNSNKPQQWCCLAIGSRDRSLSVWTTALQRPLVVIHDLFNDSILDLSWGQRKFLLMACSGDGSVACLQFKETDLGTPLSEEEQNTLYQRIYGKSVVLENGSGSQANMIIENPELLVSVQDKPKPPTFPTIIDPSNNISNRTVPMNGFSAETETVFATMSSNSSTSSGRKAISQQLEVRTADGKRRVTPRFIPPTEDIYEVSMSSTAAAVDAPSEVTVISSSNNNSIQSTTQPTITEAEQTRLDSRLVKITNPSSLAPPRQANRAAVNTFPTTAKNKSTLASGQYQASTGGPKLNITQNTKCEFQKTALDYRIHVHNGNTETINGPLAKVTAFAVSIGERIWETFVGSPIVNFNFCSKYVMLCSLDGTMRLLNMENGCAVLPIISLASAAIQCAFCPLGKLVGVITDCGILRIWNIENHCITLATTCTEIFGKFGTVAQFTITDRGVPMVLFANGNSYSYSQVLQSWLVLTTKDPIMRHGLQTTMPKEFNKNYRFYPLTSMQASTNNYSSSNMDLNSGTWQSNAKISFIENQIKLCEAINSPEELKFWYTNLAFILATHGTEKRLRLLLNYLLGPLMGFSPHHQKKEDTKILSIPKHSLMETVLDVLKPHTKWQRVYMEYNDLFENCKGGSGPTNSISNSKRARFDDQSLLPDNDAEDVDDIFH